MIIFGLSMDYQVFLLSRIRERHAQTGDNRDAIEFGIASTARLITGAALIIVAVFAGFAAGELVAFQQMGFGSVFSGPLVRSSYRADEQRAAAESQTRLPPHSRAL